MDYLSIVYQNLFMNQSYTGGIAAFFGGYDGVGLLSNFFGEKSVLIIDIDPEVLEWWEKISEEQGFDITLIKYDAREPIDDSIKVDITKFDIDAWRTDPPYNCAGMFCFLSRIFYLNEKKVPVYLTVPTGHCWSDLLKHNVWKFIIDSGKKITGVSPSLFNYTHYEGPDSFAWKIEGDSYNMLIDNDKFVSDIYGPSILFANSALGCKQYDVCKSQRNEWDKVIESRRTSVKRNDDIK